MADAAVAAVAAIATVRDLVVVTHNTKHFLPLGVAVATPDEVVRLGELSRGN